MAHQVHQQANFGIGSIPVLGAERENSQVFNAHLRAGLGNWPQALGARSVPRRARQMARTGPAVVAIHDDDDMLGKRLGNPIPRRRQVVCIGRAWGMLR